ncbi:transglutaminase family protein [Aestuariibaculum sediminum]|uniref:Transglutaminase family protein n=1 Tax=Aestuariibaculum sediminum TaxID=2770637 RepID=A0A8J6QJL6_9FLAO|nr:transglutaminase family protein [Aestuariibaculum sediminum]MBD0832869.1 transglutaminase family protein [Aestuariibaculum sediminum]
METYYIKHITKYVYDHPVLDAANQIRLHPINDEFQQVISHYLIITNNAHVQTHTDYNKNVVGSFMITDAITELYIESNIEVNTFKKELPQDTIPPNNQWKELENLKYTEPYVNFLIHRPFTGTNDLSAVIANKNIKQKSVFQALLELCDYVFNVIKYTKGVTNVNSSIDEVWSLKAGVCQDFTNIMLQMVRMCGIPARYVSGYICPNDDITRGEGATHAWIEAYIPFYGWLGFDPTNNIIGNENHVRLAVGRDYNDCAPVKGVFKGNATADLFVKVHVSKAKQNEETLELPETPMSSTKNNSYKRHLERIQQQQQQQQQA